MRVQATPSTRLAANMLRPQYAYQGHIQRRFWDSTGSAEIRVTKFYFHGKFLINLGYYIYPKYSYPLTLYLLLPDDMSILLPMYVCKTAG